MGTMLYERDMAQAAIDEDWQFMRTPAEVPNIQCPTLVEHIPEATQKSKAPSLEVC